MILSFLERAWIKEKPGRDFLVREIYVEERVTTGYCDPRQTLSSLTLSPALGVRYSLLAPFQVVIPDSA